MTRPSSGDLIGDAFARALAHVNAMSPDERAHMYHAQRASFAYANLALDKPGASVEELSELMLACERAAGPCPCGTCTATAAAVARGAADVRDAVDGSE